MAKSQKLLKEEFVSNLIGGSMGEINIVTAVAPIAYIVFSVLQSHFHFFDPRAKYGPIQLLIDFFLSAVAMLLSTTLYSSIPTFLNIALLAPALILYFTFRPPKPRRSPKLASRSKKDNQNSSESPSPDSLPKKGFITVYRGSMMVITCIAILAVDFKIFPRRFAKAENWGTSLMDLGVGSFVFSSGVVSARSVLKTLVPGNKSTALSSSPPPALAKRLNMAMRSSLPLLALGFIRLAMVKGVDYAEHVTEYGVHWNFFFTLGFLPPFVALLQVVPLKGSPELVYALLSLLIGGGYQLLLEFTDLKAYVLVGDRHKYGLLGMNKEGISSFSGYLAIFLAGVSTGIYVLPRDTSGSKKKLPKTLFSWSMIWVLLLLASSERWGFGIGISRRLANLPYFLWVAAFNTVQMMAFYMIEQFFFKSGGNDTAVSTEEEEYKFAVPKVLEGFNRNGLAVFLVANLLTGAVNLSINTLSVGRIAAMGVLVGYMFVLTCVAVGLDYMDLSIKL